MLDPNLGDRHARHEHRLPSTGTTPPRQASASVSIDVGGIPGIGLVNGRVWHDADFDRVYDANEIALAGWTVELYLNDSLAHVARTSADGIYRMSGVEPNYATTDTYEMRFRRPGAGATHGAARPRATPSSRTTCSAITDIVVLSGSNLQNLNLPIDPNGIVYDALSPRTDRGRDRDARCRERRRRAVGVLLRSRTSRAKSRWQTATTSSI